MPELGCFGTAGVGVGGGGELAAIRMQIIAKANFCDTSNLGNIF